MNYREGAGAVPFRNVNESVEPEGVRVEDSKGSKSAEAMAQMEVTELFRDFQTKIDIYSPFALDEIDGSDCSRPNSPTLLSTALTDGQKGLDTDIVVVGSFLDKLPNLAGLARTCEIFGVRTLYVPDLAALASTDFVNVAMTAEKWLDIRQLAVKDMSHFLETIKCDQGTSL